MLGNSLNDIWTQNFPEADDQIREISLAYVHIGPKCLFQLLLGNHVLCPSNQAKKSVERFGLKSNRDCISLELAITRIEQEIAKPICRLNAALIFL